MTCNVERTTGSICKESGSVYGYADSTRIVLYPEHNTLIKVILFIKTGTEAAMAHSRVHMMSKT